MKSLHDNYLNTLHFLSFEAYFKGSETDTLRTASFETASDFWAGDFDNTILTPFELELCKQAAIIAKTMLRPFRMAVTFGNKHITIVVDNAFKSEGPFTPWDNEEFDKQP